MFAISQSGLEAINKRFRDMREQLRQLRHDVPQHYFDWQKTDLHSKEPWVKRTGRKGSRARTRHYLTIILPHSQREMNYRRKAALRVKRRRLKSRRTGMTKPILRPRLEEQLWEDLSALLDTIKW